MFTELVVRIESPGTDEESQQKHEKPGQIANCIEGIQQ